MTSEMARPTRRLSSPESARIPISNSLLSLLKSRPHGIRGAQSYPLRYVGLHPGPSVHPPCFPHKPRFCRSTKLSPQPLAVCTRFHRPLPQMDALSKVTHQT